MTHLPHSDPPFAGQIARLLQDATPARMTLNGPPQGAPNVVVILLDDVGFGSFETFGGPVPTPTCNALAEDGLKYNQFHTTALC